MAKKSKIPTPKACKKCIYKYQCQGSPTNCEYSNMSSTAEQKVAARKEYRKFLKKL